MIRKAPAVGLAPGSALVPAPIPALGALLARDAAGVGDVVMGAAGIVIPRAMMPVLPGVWLLPLLPAVLPALADVLVVVVQIAPAAVGDAVGAADAIALVVIAVLAAVGDAVGVVADALPAVVRIALGAERSARGPVEKVVLPAAQTVPVLVVPNVIRPAEIPAVEGVVLRVLLDAQKQLLAVHVARDVKVAVKLPALELVLEVVSCPALGAVVVMGATDAEVLAAEGVLLAVLPAPRVPGVLVGVQAVLPAALAVLPVRAVLAAPDALLPVLVDVPLVLVALDAVDVQELVLETVTLPVRMPAVLAALELATGAQVLAAGALDAAGVVLPVAILVLIPAVRNVSLPVCPPALLLAILAVKPNVLARQYLVLNVFKFYQANLGICIVPLLAFCQ